MKSWLLAEVTTPGLISGAVMLISSQEVVSGELDLPSLGK
jgi:hypothetical protein